MHVHVFAEFHQVCHEVSQAFLVLLLYRFFEFFGGMLYENARGAGTCGFNNLKLTLQEANDYLSVEPYNSA